MSIISPSNTHWWPSGRCMVSDHSLVVDSLGPWEKGRPLCCWIPPTHLICKFQRKFWSLVALVDGSFLLTTPPHRKWKQLHLGPPKEECGSLKGGKRPSGWLIPAALENDGTVQQSQQLALPHFGGDHQWAADTQRLHSKSPHGAVCAQEQNYKMQMFAAAGLFCSSCALSSESWGFSWAPERQY